MQLLFNHYFVTVSRLSVFVRCYKSKKDDLSWIWAGGIMHYYMCYQLSVLL